LRHLALGRAGNALALGAGLATSDTDAVPGPAGASARGTEDVNVGRTAGNSSLDVAQGQASDGDAAGGSASGAAILVVLFNDDAVLGDSRQSDVLVGDALDGASRAVDSLNTDTWKFETSVYMIDLRRMVFPRTVLRVLDGAVLDVDLVHGVVGAATDRADRDTVSSRASGTGERDILDESIQIFQMPALCDAYRARVNSQAVILVVHRRVVDVDIRAGADVESVRVMAQARAGAVVD